MKPLRTLIIPWLIALALGACRSASPDTPAGDTTLVASERAATVAPTSTSLVNPTLNSPATPSKPAMSNPPPRPATKYTLYARLDYDAHRLEVEESLSYVNQTGEALNELLLVVEPNRYFGGFQLVELAWEGDQPISNYTLEGPLLTLPLEDPMQPEESRTLSLSFVLVLPQQGASFGYTDRQTNLGDWYPFLPAYEPGEGWLVREGAYLGEHLVYDIADYQVEIDLLSPTSAAGKPLTIAASAPAELDGDRHSFTLEAARNFAWSVSDQYQALSVKVDEVDILAYSFPFHAGADGPAMQATAQALEVFSELFGPYQHNSLSVVEGDFLNGMEYDGLFFLSHAFYDYFTGTPENNLIIIAAHETAHAWFFGLVGNDQALEPWLDEALATYSESLFYERTYPDLLDWWWQNRVYFHEPRGWVDSSIYDTAGFYPYRDAIYLRGALFLQEVRSLVGDEAFFAFLRDYLNQFAYQQATGEDFLSLLRQHTSADLSPVLAEYFSGQQEITSTK